MASPTFRHVDERHDYSLRTTSALSGKPFLTEPEAAALERQAADRRREGR